MGSGSSVITTRLTIDDYELLPDEQVKHCELVNGELREVSGSNLEHNEIRALLILLLYAIVRERRLGRVVTEQEYDFGGDAHAPDITFFGSAKRALANTKKRVQRFVPDLAVEIVSPNDTFEDLMIKKEKYRNCGVSEVWIITPESRQVLIFSATGDRILSGDSEVSTPLVPGFAVPVSRLFE